MGGFIFATGIECSYPTIEGRGGRNVRLDQLESSFHYKHWRIDLELTQMLGIRYLRYGLPYYSMHCGPGRIRWDFADEVLPELSRREITPILDLCHFGVPDWIGSFQNDDWPELFAEFAGAVARRYPGVRYFTPVNEIYVCAKFSALNGWWNERLKSDAAFVRALKNLCKANLLAISVIRSVTADALFVQSESAEYFHSGSRSPEILKQAAFENERRFLPFDLMLGRAPADPMKAYLLDNGMSEVDLAWFMSQKVKESVVLGSDFYERNEQILSDEGIKPAGEVFGWATIAQQYFARYQRPLFHTETNTPDAEKAPRWLWKEFFNVRYVADLNVPVLGFTWYSLIDQLDWDSGLLLDRGVVNPVGLFDLARQARPVAYAYKELISQFGEKRPAVAN